MRAYKFRVYPLKKQEKLLMHHLNISKNVWNSLLEKSRKKYGREGKFYSKTELAAMVKKTGLFSQTAQSLCFRLYEAINRKITAKKQGKKFGFPRFKSIDRMKSLLYPQFGFSLEKKLNVTPFGEITVKQHRKIRGRIKTLTLKRESSGKYYAIFTVENEKPIPKANNGSRVGIDLGLEKFATLSDGKSIQNPRHFKKLGEKLAFTQRRLSRKKRGGRNRQKAKIRLGRMHEKIACARTDFLHKLSTELVNDYSFIAVEKLASQKMAEQNFGKQINDAGWSMFASMLCYKAEGAGCKVVFVDPKNTTKTCSNCKSIQNMPLQERTYECPICGLVIDRDLNAAKNILMRATAGTAENNACGDEKIFSSLNQEAYLQNRRF